MKKSVWVAVIAVILLSITAVTAAYAYSSSLNLPGNTVDAEYRTIDVGFPEGQDKINISAPSHTGSTILESTRELSGYTLKIGGAVTHVRAWLMAEEAVWGWLDHVSVTIDGNSYIMKNGGDTGCTTDVITGLTQGNHTLSVTLYFRSVAFDESVFSTDSCVLVFAGNDHDPLAQ